jgi:hypothetical protein
MSPSTFHELPRVIQAALDDVQADLDEPHLEPAERDLADEVQRYLRRPGLDPLSQAMIEHPKILAWCVERALRRTEPGDPALYHRAPPLAEPEEPPSEPTAPAKPPRRTRGTGRGTRS